MMKEFGNDKGGGGVIYMNKPKSALKKAVELIENGSPKEHGLKARGFVESDSWNSIADEFEGRLEDVIRGE
jgi:hypothetical protein